MAGAIMAAQGSLELKTNLLCAVQASMDAYSTLPCLFPSCGRAGEIVNTQS